MSTSEVKIGDRVEVAYSGYSTAGRFVRWDESALGKRGGWMIVAQDYHDVPEAFEVPCHADYVVAEGDPLPPGPFEEIAGLLPWRITR